MFTQKKTNIKSSESHSYKAFILKHVLKTFLNKLVCPTNQIKIIYVVELEKKKILKLL